MQVLDGVTLVPLPNSAENLPSYLPYMPFSDPGQFLSKTLLRVNMAVSPLLQQPDQDHSVATWPDKHFTIAVSGADVGEFHPAKFAQALTIVGKYPVQVALRWVYLSDRHIFNLGLAGGSVSSDTWVDVRGPSTTFSETQIQEGADLYRKLAGLPDDVQRHLQIPLDRWVKSKTNQGYVDKMIDLGIALESFYLRGIRNELSFRLRLRASLHLEDGIEQRRPLMNEFRQIYDIRSTAVHEGTVPEQVNVKGQNVRISEFVDRSQELFKRSLLKVIENGRLPDWDSIELGVEKRLTTIPGSRTNSRLWEITRLGK